MRVLPSPSADYVVEAFLGAGAQAEVYLARHRETGRVRALRKDPGARLSFERRVGLRHPGIVEAHEAFADDSGGTWLVEDFVAGQSWLPHTRPGLLVEDARTLLYALAFLHDHGLVHGDVKDANVMLAPDDRPVFVDFGLCRRFDEDMRGGTLGNAAPEILGGRVDPRRIDLFALGTSLLAGLRDGAVDARWSYDSRALNDALDAAPSEYSAMLRALCSPSAGERAKSAGEVLALLPASTRVMSQGETWPLAGRESEIDTATRFFEGTKGHAVLCIAGVHGSGRSRLARAIAPRVGIDPDGSYCVEIADPLGEAIERFAARARAGVLRAVTWTSGDDVSRCLVAAFGLDRVLVMDIANLDSSAIQQLARWLPLEDFAIGRDLTKLLEATDGHPASLVRLTTAGRAEAPTEVEVWLALRGGSVESSLISASRAAELEAALRRGRISRRRDGTWQLPSSERRDAIVGAQDRHALVGLHRALADESDGWERDYHAACAGDTAVTGSALAGLLAILHRGEAELAAVGLQHWVELRGRRAVVHHALAPLLRALVESAQLELVARVLRRVPDDAPASLLAVSAYFEGERGNLVLSQKRAALALASAREHKLEPDVDSVVDLARSLQWTGDWIEAERLLANAPARNAKISRLRVLVLHRLGRRREAEELAQRTLAELGDDQIRLRIGILQNLALVLRQRGALEAHSRVQEEAGQLAESVGDVRNAAIAWINSAITLQDLGQLEEAQKLRQRAHARASSAGLAQVRDIASAGLGIGDVYLGAWPAAARALEETSASLAAQGMQREARLCTSWSAYARIAALGDHASATMQSATTTQSLMEGARATLRDNLTIDLEAGNDSDAAVHWSLALGGAPAASSGGARLQPRQARRLLRAADRSTRETILVRLRARGTLTSARPSDLASLNSLSRSALSAPRFEARVVLAKASRVHGLPRARQRSAVGAMLRAARASDSPAERLCAWSQSWAFGRPPRILARRIMRDVAAVERLRANPSDEPTLPIWTQSLADLRALARRELHPARGREDNRVRRSLLEIQRLLLDVPGGGTPRASDDCFRKILDEAIDLVHGKRGRIVTRARGDRYECARVRGSDGVMRDEDFDFSRSLIDEVMESGTPRSTLNASDDPEWSMAASVVEFHLVSIACVPIRSGEEILGALYLDNPLESGRFREDALEIIEAFALQVALGLSAARQRSELRAAKHELEGRLDDAQRELAAMRDGHGMLWQSAAMESMMREVRRFAPTDLPVHVHGATGVGKELVARKIHELSSRRSGPFVSENCSAIASELFESELFGHVAGAFTGATQDKIGLLRSASGGTLFLDEIGDLPLEHQARLLRVLQEGEVRPVGSEKSERVDLRLVTATHRDLAAMVAEKTFREDLFYRVVIAKVEVPPLRDRRDDIPLLATLFARQAAGQQAVLTPAALAMLGGYDWPGNVRQLESYVRSAVVLRRSDVIDVDDLPPLPSMPNSASSSGSGELPMRLDELEELALRRALVRAQGNRNDAAALLGISRSSVFAKIKKYGLNDRDSN